jgi:uncharacterized protein YoxC
MGPQTIAVIYQLSAPILAIAALIGFYVNAIAASKAANVGKELSQKLDQLNTTIGALNTAIAVAETRHEELDRRVSRLEAPVAPAASRA